MFLHLNFDGVARFHSHCRRRGIDGVGRFGGGGSDLNGKGGKVDGKNEVVGEGAEREVGCFTRFFYDRPIIKGYMDTSSIECQGKLCTL